MRYDNLVIAINNKFMRRMPAPRLAEDREATQLEHRPVLPSNWEEELEEQDADAEATETNENMDVDAAHHKGCWGVGRHARVRRHSRAISKTSDK